MASGGSLYPDHVIFLGQGSIVARPGEDVPRRHRRGCGAAPVAILFPGRGVLMRGDASAGADAMQRCLADVTARVDVAATAELSDRRRERRTDQLGRREVSPETQCHRQLTCRSRSARSPSASTSARPVRALSRCVRTFPSPPVPPSPLERFGPDARDPAVWWRAVGAALTELLSGIDRAAVRSIAVDGTSGTLLPVDSAGRPLAEPLMYNDTVADDAILARSPREAPASSAAHGATSGLAKALWFQRLPGVAAVLHQADWIAGQFSGRFDVSDENNALKTGYDVEARRWPDWIAATGMRMELLPESSRRATWSAGSPRRRGSVRPAARRGRGRRHDGWLRLVPGDRRCGSRRRRHGARLVADHQDPFRPADLCAAVRHLQPSARRCLAGWRRVEHRRQGAGPAFPARAHHRAQCGDRPHDRDRPRLLSACSPPASAFRSPILRCRRA